MGGEKWQTLSASTIRQREKKGHWPGKKLQRSPGGLAPSVQPFHDANRTGLTRVEALRRNPPAWRQAGRGHKVTIPARGYMPMRKEGSDLELTPTARSVLLEMMADFVEAGLDGPGECRIRVFNICKTFSEAVRFLPACSGFFLDLSSLFSREYGGSVHSPLP